MWLGTRISTNFAAWLLNYEQHCILSHFVDLICIHESNLNSFSSFRIPEFIPAMRSDGTHPGLAFSLQIPRTLAAATSFLSDRAFPFMYFLPPLFLRLIPTLIT